MKVKLLLSVLLLMVIIAGSILLEQEVLRLHAVVVNGCETRPPEEVTALADVAYGESIFAIKLEDVKANVERSPYYRVDGIKRLYPDKIQVSVHERRPRAVVLFMGAYLIMDEEGFVLEIRQDKGYAQCPMVSGLKIETYGVGQQVRSSDGLQVPAMKEVLLALERQDVTRYVSQILMDNAVDIRMMTTDGYRVMLGDADQLDGKLGWLVKTLGALRSEGLYGGTVYVSAANASYLPLDAGAQTEGTQEGDFLWPDQGNGLPVATPGDAEPNAATPSDIAPDGAALGSATDEESAQSGD